jgi:hypothetical protein
MTEEERQRHIQALELRVADLRRRLEEIGIVLRGSVVERWMPCGRKGCACQAVPPKLHGPYHQWTRKVDGKTKTVRLTKAEAAAYRQWIDNGRRLDAVIQEWEQTGIAAAQEIRAK